MSPEQKSASRLVISESSQGNKTISFMSVTTDNDFLTNNCHAGNCSTKSCKKYNIKKLHGSNNCGKNCVTSCGKKH